MSATLIWIVVGIVLIISELLLTSVIAVFFGIGAVVTGLLLQLGIIESMTTQFVVFGVVSLLSLFLARGKFERWFKGYTADKSEGQADFQHDIGARGTVVDDFAQGSGRITLNGVRWKAFSDEDLKSGDTVWVSSNNGIELTVSRNKPEIG
jgi:inner membrane protein